jgi:hypothetical protein
MIAQAVEKLMPGLVDPSGSNLIQAKEGTEKMKKTVCCYGTHRWAAASLCTLSVVIAVLCFAAFYNWNTWAGQAPALIRWFLLLMGLIFLLSGTMPKNWRPWWYFIADAHGLRFPSQCPQTANTQWLLVPWNRIGTVKKELFYDRFKGPSIELDLQDPEIDRFFRDVQLKKMFFDKALRENGFFKVGYSNAFMKVDDVVDTLNKLRKTLDSTRRLP